MIISERLELCEKSLEILKRELEKSQFNASKFYLMGVRDSHKDPKLFPRLLEEFGNEFFENLEMKKEK